MRINRCELGCVLAENGLKACLFFRAYYCTSIIFHISKLYCVEKVVTDHRADFARQIAARTYQIIGSIVKKSCTTKIDTAVSKTIVVLLSTGIKVEENIRMSLCEVNHV